LKANGVIIHRSTYQSLTDIKQVSEEHMKLHLDFDAQVKNKLGKGYTAANLVAEDIESPTYDLYADDISGEQRLTVDQEEEVTPEGGDEYINVSVTLPQGGSQIDARVIACKRDAEGQPLGRCHNNLVLDTRVYEVEFPDGTILEYLANVIAENMWAQCDLDGQERLLMQAIIDHRKDGNAVR
jgi:hypothetical protein